MLNYRNKLAEVVDQGYAGYEIRGREEIKGMSNGVTNGEADRVKA